MGLRIGNSAVGVFLRYIVVGGINAGLGYGFFLLLTWLLHDHLPWQAILVIAYIYPVVVGFLGNKHLVFRSRGSWQREHLRFLLVFTCSIAVNYLATWVLITQYGFGSRIAQLVATVISAISSCLGSYIFVFVDRPQASSQPTAQGATTPPGAAAAEQASTAPPDPRNRRADHPASGS